MKKLIVIGLSCLLICGCNKNNINDIEVVKKRIENIEKVSDICVVTEDNDPNGQLNKQGGYIGALYFSLDSIDYSNDEDYQDTCEMGTDSGGSIEIYGNVEDAKKRNEYLKSFDGTAFSNYHKLNKNIIIRLSNKLTATEQKDLAEKITKKLNDAN